MPRHILTGAPGAGKSTLLRQLEIDGFAVIEEAATDIVALALARGEARPEASPGFIDAIVALQAARQRRAETWPDEVQVFDRSPVCTLALCRFLGRPPTAALLAELERVRAGRIYSRRVLFVRNIGFCAPTPVRRITFEDALRFEAVHEETYRDLGYELAMIAPGPLAERATAVRAAMAG